MNISIVADYQDQFDLVAPLTEVPYLKVFEWELIEINRYRKWMGEHWKISVYASFLYVNLIYFGSMWMKNRQPFKLRGILSMWNIVLAIFSLIGFFRTAPEIFHTLKEENGFHKSVCTRQGHNAATAFWALLMVWSKLIELGDTAFIVLKKQKLIFLHWYHHISVLIYVWATFERYEPSLRYFMSINMFIHALMYSYYALKSLRIKVPRNIAMMITCLQLSQMFVGCYINFYLLYTKSKSRDSCNEAGFEGIWMAFGMYASYAVLFANFFYHSYFGKSKKE